jgi:hypothetical protein
MAELNLSEKAMGWRKRQMVEAQVNAIYVSPSQRNQTLEEVAQEFDNMKIAFGDTAASFSQYVRSMKT